MNEISHGDDNSRINEISHKGNNSKTIEIIESKTKFNNKIYVHSFQ